MFVGGSSSVFWKGASLSENIQRMYAVIGKRNIAVLRAVNKISRKIAGLTSIESARFSG